MATFEQLKLAFQVEQAMENLRANMRANAQGYLDALTAGKSLATIVAVASANSVQYQRILGWLLGANNNATLKAKVQAGLTALSLLYTDVTAMYQEMLAAANAEQAAQQAGLPDAASVQAMATATLTNVAAHDSLWPNG